MFSSDAEGDFAGVSQIYFKTFKFKGPGKPNFQRFKGGGGGDAELISFSVGGAIK